MDFCGDRRFDQLGPCEFGAFSSAIAILLILLQSLYALRIRFGPTIAQYHSGYLPYIFVLNCLAHLCILVIPIIYVASDRTPLGAPLIVFLGVHSLFWMTSLVCKVMARNFYNHPPLLAMIDAIVLLLTIVPMFLWNIWTDERIHSKKLVWHYITELSLICFIYLSTLGGFACRRVIHDNSIWSNYWQKSALVMPYIWPHKNIWLQFRVFISLAFLVLGRVINVFLPLYSKWIVDGLTSSNKDVYQLILILCVLKFLQGSGSMGGFLNTARSVLWIPVQQYTTFEIQVQLFKHLHDLSLRWHLSRKTGQVLRIMDRGTSSIDSILNYLLFNVIPTIVDIIVAVIFFFFTFNVYFGVLVLLTMIIYLVFTIVITEWRTNFRRDMNEKENYCRTIGVDSLLNYETVKYYNAEKLEIKRFADAIKIFQHSEWKTLASLSFLNFTQNVTIAIGLFVGSLLVAYLILQVHSGLTAGDYILFTTYMMQLYVPLNFFGTVYRVVQQAFIDMENMFQLLAEDVEITNKPNAEQLVVRNGDIVFDDVKFGYFPDKLVLNGVSFTASKGETVALVGPSGAGKSTIIRLLFRLFDVTGGRIMFDGCDVRDLELNSLRKNIGIVPQDVVLFNETIRYNIHFGNPSANNEEIEKVAADAEIHQRILSMPQGYDTVVGERGLKLSGGEKQRVAIARTLLKKPAYILLDEATSALDTATERSIQKCISEICAQKTAIVVAHRLSTIVNANKILVLQQGSIVESGTHAELLKKQGLYFEMWAAQEGKES